MDGGFGLDNLSSLSKILQESQESQTKKEQANSQPPILTSSTVVVTSNTVPKKTDDSKAQENAKLIWDDAEILSEDALLAEMADSRPSPRYEISYKQSVGSEDTFLGLGDKTPASTDCSHLVCF